MFFASCSSSSSAIVAAGVQRLACQAVDFCSWGRRSDGFSGAARLFIVHSSFMSTTGAAPALGPSAFCKCCACTGFGFQDPHWFGDEVCARRGHGAAVPGRLGQGEAASAGR